MKTSDPYDTEGLADDLTWREQEVLNLLGERLTNREIADRLFLTENTVKDYVGKILSKLYVKNRRQAVERAILDSRTSSTSPFRHAMGVDQLALNSRRSTFQAVSPVAASMTSRVEFRWLSLRKISRPPARTGEEAEP